MLYLISFVMMKAGAYRASENGADVHLTVRQARDGVWRIRHYGRVVGDPDGYRTLRDAKRVAQEFWTAKRVAESHDARTIPPAVVAPQLVSPPRHDAGTSPYGQLDAAFVTMTALGEALGPPCPPIDPAAEDDVQELADRIVRAARFGALREMLSQLDGWIDGAKQNHEALGHRGEMEPCWEQWHPNHIRRMITDAADTLGVPSPVRP